MTRDIHYTKQVNIQDQLNQKNIDIRKKKKCFNAKYSIRNARKREREKKMNRSLAMFIQKLSSFTDIIHFTVLSHEYWNKIFYFYLSIVKFVKELVKTHIKCVALQINCFIRRCYHLWIYSLWYLFTYSKHIHDIGYSILECIAIEKKWFLIFVYKIWWTEHVITQFNWMMWTIIRNKTKYPFRSTFLFCDTCDFYIHFLFISLVYTTTKKRRSQKEMERSGLWTLDDVSTLHIKIRNI